MTAISRRELTMTCRITDSEAMRRIQLVLDGREWSGADDLQAITEVIRATGREIRPPVENEQGDDGERLRAVHAAARGLVEAPP